MADTKFMSFAEVAPLITDNVLVGNTTNGVRRTSLSSLKTLIGGVADSALNDNGYVKFTNGLIIQWGTAEWSLSSGPVDFFTSYPILMPTKTVSVVLTSTGPTLSNFRTSSTGTNGFNTVPSATSGKLKWIAIGY